MKNFRFSHYTNSYALRHSVRLEMFKLAIESHIDLCSYTFIGISWKFRYNDQSDKKQFASFEMKYHFFRVSFQFEIALYLDSYILSEAIMSMLGYLILIANFLIIYILINKL